MPPLPKPSSFIPTSFASKFSLSKAGNPYKVLKDGTTLSVFPRWGKYAWCIYSPDGSAEYGNGYATEQEAMDGLEIACDMRFVV